MGVGEILDGALTIYRRHFITFVALGVIALGLPVVLTIYAQLSGPQQHPLLIFLAALMQYLAGLLLTAGVIRVISDFYLGREASLAQALALGAQKVWPLFVVGLGKAIVIGLIFAVGLLAMVPITIAKAGALGALIAIALLGGACWLAAFVACGYGVTTQVVVLEPLGSSFDAFGRSWDLTRGRKLKVLGLALVAFILVAVPSIGIGALAGVLRLSSSSWASVLLVLAAILPVILTPVLPCVFTLMYYDLRVRREAFDLELLSQQLDAG
jgi:hypothetical protein